MCNLALSGVLLFHVLVFVWYLLTLICLFLNFQKSPSSDLSMATRGRLVASLAFF